MATYTRVSVEGRNAGRPRGTLTAFVVLGDGDEVSVQLSGRLITGDDGRPYLHVKAHSGYYWRELLLDLPNLHDGVISESTAKTESEAWLDLERQMREAGRLA